VGEEGAAWAADRSHLVGSTATMADIRRVLGHAVGLSDADVDRLTVENPLRALDGERAWMESGSHASPNRERDRKTETKT